jgi:hypothetical protein
MPKRVAVVVIYIVSDGVTVIVQTMATVVTAIVQTMTAVVTVISQSHGTVVSTHEGVAVVPTLHLHPAVQTAGSVPVLRKAGQRLLLLLMLGCQRLRTEHNIGRGGNSS